MCQSRRFSIAILGGVFLYTITGILSISHSEVTSSGLNTTVSGTAGGYDITGGTRPGDGVNLFHSFGDFSVGEAQSAVFLNNTALPTNYIISRVTGDNPSNILGTIDSTDFGSANMILMNPAGILFGANAQLNVGGSFHATTADYIKLGDDIFDRDAVPLNNSNLYMSPPSAFGFLPSPEAPAAIDVQTGVFDFDTFQFAHVLQVPEGETLSFVGGTVNVGAPEGNPPAGFVLASLGRINLISVASDGEAAFDGIGFNVDNFETLGDVNVTGNSHIDAREIFIRGGQLTLDGGTLFSGIYSLAGAPVAPPDGGEINIEVTGDVTIIGREPNLSPAGIQTYAGSAGGPQPGDVPDITIKAGSLHMTDGAQIAAQRLGDGMAADISIEADTVEIRNGSRVLNLNNWAGPGGTISVNASNITLDSAGDTAGVTGINAVSEFHPGYGFMSGAPYFSFFQFADSATVTVTANDSLTVLGNALINSDSFSFGNSGDVTVSANNMLLIGEGTNTGLISSQSGFAGNSGNVTVDANETIDMQNGFRISSNTFGSGDAGSTTVTAGQSITMTGLRTQISSSSEKPSDAQLDSFAQLFDPEFTDYNAMLNALGIAPGQNDFMQVLAVLNEIPDFTGQRPLVAVTDFTAGNGSTVTITTPTLIASADSRVETSTAWDGNAGNVVANVDTLLLDSGASIRSNSGGVLLDGSVVAGTGNGGQINVTATETITITGVSPTIGDGSFIATNTFGDGAGGDITLSAGDTVEINNGGVVSADSLAVATSGIGGDAGDITVNSGKEIKLTQGTISTRAVKSDGGDIKLTTTNLIYLENSEITTSVGDGEGAGGNIDIDPDFVILQESNIVANAHGGPGGNINIVAGNFIKTPGSKVDASSALGIDGTVNISSPDDTVSEDLAVLPDNYLDVTTLIGDRCGTSPGSSSLVDAGPGGRTVDPDGYLPSFAATTDYNNKNTKGDKSVSNGNRWWATYAHKPELQLAQISCTY